MNNFIFIYGIQFSVLVIFLSLLFFFLKKNTLVNSLFRETFLFLDLPKSEESLKNKDIIHFARNDRNDIQIKWIEKNIFWITVLFTISVYVISYLSFYFHSKYSFWYKDIIIPSLLLLSFLILFFMAFNKVSKILNKNETLLKNMNFLSTTLSTQNSYNTLRNNFLIYSGLLIIDIIIFSMAFISPELLGRQDNPLFVNIINQFNFANTFALSWFVVLFEELLFRFWLFFLIYVLAYQFYKLIRKINQKAYINDAKKQKKDKTYFYLILSVLLCFILSSLFYIAHNTDYLSIFSSVVLMLNSLWLTILFIFWRRIETNILYHFCHNFFIFITAICFTLSL